MKQTIAGVALDTQPTRVAYAPKEICGHFEVVFQYDGVLGLREQRAERVRQRRFVMLRNATAAHRAAATTHATTDRVANSGHVLYDSDAQQPSHFHGFVVIAVHVHGNHVPLDAPSV